MKTIIAIAALMLTFGAASANTFPADKPESSANHEYTASAFVLDSLQSLSEKTPFKDFAYLGERVKQKMMDLQESACDRKN